jgi:hypothetical protein
MNPARNGKIANGPRTNPGGSLATSRRKKVSDVNFRSFYDPMVFSVFSSSDDTHSFADVFLFLVNNENDLSQDRLLRATGHSFRLLPVSSYLFPLTS